MRFAPNGGTSPAGWKRNAVRRSVVNSYPGGKAASSNRMPLVSLDPSPDFQMIARASRGHAERGYRLVMNCNAEAGQTVFHIHLHLVAGRPMTWPPG